MAVLFNVSKVTACNYRSALLLLTFLIRSGIFDWSGGWSDEKQLSISKVFPSLMASFFKDLEWGGDKKQRVQ